MDQLLCSKVAELEGEIVALEVQPDHVHLFTKFPPTRAVYWIMHHLKGYTSYALRREFPWLKQRLPSLWTRSYYVGTAGEVSAETIRRYIEAQRGCQGQRER
jgi:putative transposase